MPACLRVLPRCLTWRCCCPRPARWHPEEEKNDPEFAKQLAAGCDVYVNDAFGTAHRAHASTAGALAPLPGHWGAAREGAAVGLRPANTS